MRADPDAMAEHAGDLVDDGQTQTEAAILIRSHALAALELLKDFLELVRGDAHAGIPDLDGQALPTPAAAQKHASLGRVANGVGQQVAQDARQQLDIAAHERRARNEIKLQLFGTGNLAKLHGQILEQLADGERRDIRFDHAGIQLGNIDQCAEQVLHVLQ